MKEETKETFKILFIVLAICFAAIYFLDYSG